MENNVHSFEEVSGWFLGGFHSRKNSLIGIGFSFYLLFFIFNCIFFGCCIFIFRWYFFGCHLFIIASFLVLFFKKIFYCCRYISETIASTSDNCYSPLFVSTIINCRHAIFILLGNLWNEIQNWVRNLTFKMASSSSSEKTYINIRASLTISRSWLPLILRDTITLKLSFKIN